MTTRPKVVVVLGVHRSGTSVITRGLQALGVDLGENLMPPRAGDNDRGYFEDLDIFNLNERIFTALGTNWHAVCPINEREFSNIKLDGLKLDALDILQKRLGNTRFWGFKDPRTCRLLPFWKDVFAHLGLDCRYLLVNRNPISVARSLAARNSFGASKSYLLWVQHVLGAIQGSAGHSRLVVDYDMMMASPAAQVQRIGNWLGISDQALLKKSVDDYAAGFVAEDLRHSVFREEDLKYDTAAFEIARRSFRLMRSLAADEISFDSADLLGEWAKLNEAYESIAPVFSFIDDQDRHLEELGQALTDTEKARQEIAADHIRRGEWGLGLQADLEALRKSYADLEADHIRRGEWGLALQAELEAEHIRHDERERLLQAELDALRTDYQVLSADNVGRGEWAVSLQAELEALRGSYQQLSAENSRRGEQAYALQAQIREIRDSTSWRLTFPLRLVGGFLKGDDYRWLRLHSLLSKLTRAVYRRLPLAHHRKAALKSYAYRYLPTVARKVLFTHSWRPMDAVRPDLQVAVSLPQENLSPADLAKIVIPSSETPEVSIVIPVFNNIAYTVACLESIQAVPCRHSYEVVIVDDCSSDQTPRVLAGIKGVRTVRNESNQGFIRSCNRGAAEARGGYLLFLNNDTTVLPGWLDELVDTFTHFPNAGLVGAKLIYPDGRLQEAGGIIWNDASGWNYGRLDDPDKPEYNYAREVDYCSGAAIMVPRPLFETLGSFDERYLPAYFEDADLAFSVRQAGRQVLYQPLSQVIHHEGISSGTDLGSGVKAYQVVNREKFAGKWKARLALHRSPGEEPFLERERSVRGRILVIDATTPMPDRDAGSVTAFFYLKILVELGYKVCFAPANLVSLEKYTADLQRLGIECLYGPHVTSIKQHLKDSGKYYDYVFLYRAYTAWEFIRDVKALCPQAKVIFDTVDLHYLREERLSELSNSASMKAQAARTKEVELSLVSLCDATIVLSPVEKDILLRERPGARIHTIPLLLDIPGSKTGFKDRHGLVFIGGYGHPPNVDAVLYFAESIWPLIKAQIPDITFTILGSSPPDSFRPLARQDGIRVVGYVEDLGEYFDTCTLSIAPLRFGAGIKGKIGTSFCYGVPCVASSVAVEGMGLTDGREVLVADTPAAFAEAVCRLYREQDTWAAMSERGLAFVRENYSLEAGKRKLEQLLVACSPATYSSKMREELSRFENVVEVHALPAIFHYWSNKYLLPMIKECGFSSVDEFYAKYFFAAAKRTGAPVRFISIGAGNCDLEIRVALLLRDMGLQDFVFECLELNPHMLDRGRADAVSNSVDDVLVFVEGDFNTWTPGARYSAVMANHSLHHVVNLERLFDAIKSSLHPQGYFVSSDMIGRNGHQRWPEALLKIQELWKTLPDEYRFNHLLQRSEPEFINHDCSTEGFEGIRAQDILPLLIERFDFPLFIGFANTISPFIDRCFGHNFNSASEFDRTLIDKIHSFDEEGFKSGKLKPTQMFAVMSPVKAEARICSRGLSPEGSVRYPD